MNKRFLVLAALVSAFCTLVTVCTRGFQPGTVVSRAVLAAPCERPSSRTSVAILDARHQQSTSGPLAQHPWPEYALRRLQQRWLIQKNRFTFRRLLASTWHQRSDPQRNLLLQGAGRVRRRTRPPRSNAWTRTLWPKLNVCYLAPSRALLDALHACAFERAAHVPLGCPCVALPALVHF